MKVLVTGGRHYDNTAFLRHVLDKIHAKRPITVLIHGDAAGADSRADCWACDKDIEVARFPAHWDRLSHRAGLVRNIQMLTEAEPDLVVAFKGGTGTTHMVLNALRIGVPVLKTWTYEATPA